MDSVKLRSATLDDLPDLYEFEQMIVLAERPYDSTLKPGHITYYDLKAMINSDDSEVVVAVHKDEVIGSGYAQIREAQSYLNHERYAYLGFMYVKPNYRGMGVNKSIVEALTNWSRSQDLKEIRLDVYDDNYAAVRAYEKVGFKKHLVLMRMEIE